MARTKSNGTNPSTATIGFEAGTESSPELQLARAMAGFFLAISSVEQLSNSF